MVSSDKKCQSTISAKDELVVEELATEKSVTEELATEKSVIEKSVIEEPTVEELALAKDACVVTEPTSTEEDLATTAMKESAEDMERREKIQNEFAIKFKVGTEWPSLKDFYDACQAFGIEHNCPMTTLRSCTKRQPYHTMQCIHGGEYRLKDTTKDSTKTTAASREKNSMKMGCGAFVHCIYSSRTKTTYIKACNPGHNHRIAKQRSTYHQTRKMPDETVQQASTLLKSLTPTETLKILNGKGIDYVIRKDLENYQQQNLSGVDDMAAYIHQLQEKSYNVRYTVNSERRINNVFIIHQHSIDDLRRLPECVIIDATYKTNQHKYKLVNIVISGTTSSKERPNQCTTIPIAIAWFEREKEECYTWMLQQLRNIVWPEDAPVVDLELPDVFVTDNDTGVRNAIAEVFPECSTLLCWIHVRRNFTIRFMKALKTKDKTERKDAEERHDTLFMKMAIGDSVSKTRSITTSETQRFQTADEYDEARLEYISYIGTTGLLNDTGSDLLSYFETMCAIDHLWAGHPTNQLYHMNNRSTNRVEGTHAAQKSDLRSSTGKLSTATSKITAWCLRREVFRKQQMEKESVRFPVSIVRSGVEQYMGKLKTDITDFALRMIKNEIVEGFKLKKEDKWTSCSCYTYVWRLPCKHYLLHDIEKYGYVKLETVHKRWYIHHSSGESPLSTDVSSSTSIATPAKYNDIVNNEYLLKFKHVVNQLENSFLDCTTYQEKQAILDTLKDAVLAANKNNVHNINPPSIALQSKGRPKKAKRRLIQEEHVRKSVKQLLKEAKKAEKRAKKEKGSKTTSRNETSKRKKSSKVVKPSKKRKLDISRYSKAAVAIDSDEEIIEMEPILDDSDDEPIIMEPLDDDHQKTGIPKEPYADIIHPSILKDYVEKIHDNSGKGFCGYKAVAQMVYGDENRFIEVKMKMRDVLLENEHLYAHYLKDNFEFQIAKHSVCYGIEPVIGDKRIYIKPTDSCDSDFYFSAPVCVQLACDTFRRPIASYDEAKYDEYSPPGTFFPIINVDKKLPAIKNHQQPLVLHRVNNNHFVSVSMRYRYRIEWPLPYPKWYDHYEAKMLDRSLKKGLWRHITFCKPKQITQTDLTKDIIE